VGLALFEPAHVWSWVRLRLAHRLALPWLLATAVAGGLVVATATEVGVRVFNTDWNYVAGYTAQVDRGAGPFVLLWATAASLSVVQGLCGGLLLPMYGKARDFTGGMAVGVVGSLPIYATAPALVMLPGILLLCVAFGVPEGEAADHVVASIVAGSLAVSVLAAWLAVAWS
jgi:hypothetical protein